MSYTYDYPRPMVTVDILLLRIYQNHLRTLLVRRGHPPFQGAWALPGGFIGMDEKLEESAERELAEETGLKDIPLFFLTTAGDPGRDPRGRTITAIYGGILSASSQDANAGSDAAEARWFSLTNLPPLAFDHFHIIEWGLDELKFKALWRLWILLFVPGEFTVTDLEKICRLVLGSEKYCQPVVKAAQQFDWIDDIDGRQYRKKVADNTILQTPVSQLASLWISLW